MTVSIKFYVLILYFLVLAIVFYDTRLPEDSYYYIQWSQHLELSYFDGPPLIAYALRMYTFLFGTQEFVILSFAMIISMACCLIIWRTAILFFDKTTADYALYIWLFSPGTLYFFSLQTTYHTVMIFFWALSVYAFGLLIIRKKTRHYYYTGVSLGLLLLSHCSGCLLLISLLLSCIVYKECHFILKTNIFI